MTLRSLWTYAQCPKAQYQNSSLGSPPGWSPVTLTTHSRTEEPQSRPGNPSIPGSRLLKAYLFLALLACDGGDGGPGPDPDPIPRYELTVIRGEGILGYPESSQFTHNTIETIPYLYSLLEGSSELVVTLDGTVVPDSGSFIMNRDHRLVAACERRALWLAMAPDLIYYPSTAVADDGTVFFGTRAYSLTDHGSLLAVSPSGEILWTRDLGGNWFSPAIGQDGTVFVQDSENTVYAFSPGGDQLCAFGGDDFDNPIHPKYPVGR